MKISTFATFLLTAGPAVVARPHRVRGRRLQQLVGFGGEPNPSRLPLGPCQGDCDSDADCQQGLVCFQRAAPPPGGAWPEVPGCIGGSQFTAKTDFCIFPILPAEESPPPTIAPTYSPTESPSDVPSLAPSEKPTAFPTKDGATAAPSTPTPTNGPTTETPSTAPSWNAYWDLPEADFVGDGLPSSGLSLGLCQGDCDVDEDCLDELVCYQRRFDEPIPWCRGNALNSVDYCVKPPPTVEEVPPATMSPTTMATAAPTDMVVALQTVGDEPEMPLGICQGDCDTNDDCLDDLICFQRDHVEPVPGCVGTGSVSYDYCIIDPYATASPTMDPNSTPAPSEPITMSPTTTMTDAPTTNTNTGAPTNWDPLVISAFEPPTASPTFQPLLATVDKDSDGPLGLCEGKCKTDDDCEGDLICLDRDSEDEVPGCGGSPHKGDDYCIYPL
ncbi:expressed unknown protein [Seminavis robusta]|uniref:Uncharacterized protein n=1 Tax=Seminavis robusta TaxID=568900 RepID=A0A9N8DWW0_9STRA|nr:expressed unknown protein [Seminavis robusta]|eukprot:Sro437_g142740.1 n/a (443) ;mRNA; f:5722-7483